MTPRRRQLSISPLALATAWMACAAVPGRDVAAEALPDVMAPLTWRTPIGGLGAAFPGSVVEVHALERPRRTLAVVRGATNPVLGDVQVVAEATSGGELTLVGFTSEDRRAPCRLDGRSMEEVPATVDCGWRRGPRALATVRAWEGALRKRLGPPSGTSDQPGGELERRWSRAGYELRLALSPGDDGAWSVALTARRTEPPPSMRPGR